jgi:hypothetical protein
LTHTYSARLNGSQPPMTWLAAQAAQLDGRLVGRLPAGKAFVCIDGIQVPAATARQLAEAIATAWPATAEALGALETAVAEAWDGWAAEWPVWTGARDRPAREAAAVGSRSGRTVVGLTSLSRRTSR